MSIELHPWTPHRRHSHTPIGRDGSTGLAGATVAGELDLAEFALPPPPLAPLPEPTAALATAPLLSLRQGPHCPILHLQGLIKYVCRMPLHMRTSLF